MVKNNFLSSEMFRPLLFAVLLPLGLAAIGGIQFFFFTQSPATLAEIRQQLREEHSRLQSLPRGGQVPKVVPPSIKPGAPKGENGAVKPKDASRTPGGRRANQELANVAAALEIIEKELPFQTIRRFSSLLAMFAGLAASVLGMAGLAMIAYISPRAMQSREYLLAAFSRLRTVFPVLLMFQSTALVVAGVCVLVFLAAGAARGGKDEWRLLIASVLFILVFIGIGAVVIWRLIKALRSVFEPRAIALHGEDIDRADAPQLWQFVEDISRKAHSIVPDNIVLGLTHGFFVTACDITLDHGNRCISGKTLHLSLPQMAFLNRGRPPPSLAMNWVTSPARIWNIPENSSLYTPGPRII